MKKLYIRDEHGEEYEVEEIEETRTETDAPAETSEVEAEALTKDEIVALKKLASVADKLVSMIGETKDACKDEDKENEEKAKDTEPDVDVEKDVNVDVETRDEDEDIEQVIDTDTKACDSKKSFGAIEKKTMTNDSIDAALEVESAWEKRYNGGK